MAGSDSEQTSRIFPLINRQTPVMDRIRDRDRGVINRLRNGSGDDGPVDLERIIGEAIDSDDERLEKLAELAEDSTKEQIADELEIPQEAVSDNIPQRVGDVVRSIEGRGDILTEEAMEQLASEEEEDEEAEDEEDDLAEKAREAKEADSDELTELDDLDDDEDGDDDSEDDNQIF